MFPHAWAMPPPLDNALPKASLHSYPVFYLTDSQSQVTEFEILALPLWKSWFYFCNENSAAFLLELMWD